MGVAKVLAALTSTLKWKQCSHGSDSYAHRGRAVAAAAAVLPWVGGFRGVTGVCQVNLVFGDDELGTQRRRLSRPYPHLPVDRRSPRMIHAGDGRTTLPLHLVVHPASWYARQAAGDTRVSPNCSASPTPINRQQRSHKQRRSETGMVVAVGSNSSHMPVPRVVSANFTAQPASGAQVPARRTTSGKRWSHTSPLLCHCRKPKAKNKRNLDHADRSRRGKADKPGRLGSRRCRVVPNCFARRLSAPP